MSFIAWLQNLGTILFTDQEAGSFPHPVAAAHYGHHVERQNPSLCGFVSSW